ncbi:uroporphyrinogen-III synthase [Tessaracoccus sp. OH4464_COT-324]|uniref:uroporphyrinogen-III synthase n=1 Tax=Tessaracoccus sp. OH4464_COT-324 TaxID=2491059 RepID=UPI0035198182
MQVLLPREEGALADGLRAAGAEVTCCPVLETVVLATPEVLAADWVVFTSPRGVALLDRGPTRVAGRIAAVGGATARALTSRGYAVDLCPEGASSAAALLTLWPAGSGRVLLPGSARSGPELAEGLSRRGYTVERLATYDVHAAATVPEPVVAAWRRGDFDAVVITSGSVGEAFSELFGWHDTPVVAFGPPSAEALRAAGVPVAGTAPTQDPQGVAAALARLPD